MRLLARDDLTWRLKFEVEPRAHIDSACGEPNIKRQTSNAQRQKGTRLDAATLRGVSSANEHRSPR
jgi:hypothetical protein